MTPEVSIIVPIYNADQYLHECIESVLNQTFSNFELILVDDGSTDTTKEVCKRYQKLDERIVYFYKSNGGSSSAKNLGIRIARGKYIEFVDADDTIDKEYVGNLVKGIKNADVDLCVGNIVFVKKKDKQCIRKEVCVHAGVYSLQDWLKYYPEYMPKAIVGAPWNKLYKKEIIQKENLEFDENLKNNEDTQFNYGYLEKCRNIYMSDKPYYNYTDRGKASASKGYIDNIFDVYLSTYKKANSFLKTVGMYECNETFTKEYFVRLVIGAINNIVITAQLNTPSKKKKIKYIVLNQEVQNALYGLTVTDKKIQLIIFFMKRKWINWIYILFIFNKMLRGKY